MGRNKGSKTGIIVTIPVICKICGNTFRVVGKHRPNGPRPAQYCSQECYHISKKGKPNLSALGSGRGAPKGRIPWNKGRKCPQLSGECNGMFGRTHTPEVRERLSKISSQHLSALTRSLLDGTQAPLKRSDPVYSILFRVGWKPIRQKALDRDNNTCQVCNGERSTKVTVHHRVPFGIILKHELDNLITLCTYCHHDAHRFIRRGSQNPIAPSMATMP